MYRLQQEAAALEADQKKLLDADEKAEKDRRVREQAAKEKLKRDQMALKEEQEKAEAALQKMQDGEEKKKKS